MKRLFPILAVLCVLAGTFTSCNINTPVNFTEVDLMTKWKAQSDVDETAFQYCIFLSDKDDTGEYRLGKMWDEGDDVTETDVDQNFLGNGWFKWKLTGDELMEIHLMDNEGAEIPKYYTITTLNETTLIYEDSFGNSITWKR